MSDHPHFATLASAWESYLSGVIPFEADDVQVRESRLAFYAGARAFQAPLEAAVKLWSENPARFAQILNDLTNELYAFKALVEQGEV